MLDQINYLNQIGAGAAHEGSAYLPIRQRRSATDRADYFNQRLLDAIRKENDSANANDLSDSMKGFSGTGNQN